MSGHFHEIIGKTISGVYCRENENIPKGQVFITFDDGTYFEMYTMSDEIKGTKGLNTGVLDDVVSLNHPEGKEICRYPVSDKIMMWIPPLDNSYEKRVALAVPTDVKIQNSGDYWELLKVHVQNLIDQLPEDEAKRLIDYYLIKGSDITKHPGHHDWAEDLCLSDEVMYLIGELQDLDFDSLQVKQHDNTRVLKKNLTLENLLKTICIKFYLTDDDNYLINKMDELIVLALKRCSLSPVEIVSCGRLLHVLRRLPLATHGLYISISFTVKDIPSLFLEFQVSDERIALMLGNTEAGDTHYLIDWYIDMGGDRSEDNDSDDVYYMEENPLYREGVSIEVSIDDQSESISF